MTYKVPFKNYVLWYNIVQRRLVEINEENEMRTINWYSLGYRGKRRRLCLIKNDFEVLACGMRQITIAIKILRNGRNLFED